MIPLLRHFVGWLVGAFLSREGLILENLALHQQLLALHAKRPRRRLGSLDRLFWLTLRKVWWMEEITGHRCLWFAKIPNMLTMRDLRLTPRS